LGLIERKIGVLVEGALLLVLLSPVVRMTFADVGPGILSDVQYPNGTSVPTELGGQGQTFFIVVPGGNYRVIITNVEVSLWGESVDVWIKGKNQDGSIWQVLLPGQEVTQDGTITSSEFQIPSTAGCTIQVAYYQIGHETANPTGPGTGHMKTYYDDTPPFDNPVPCGEVGLPEFPLGPEAIAAAGLLAVLAIRRKQRH
jgi:hypothetical protein